MGLVKHHGEALAMELGLAETELTDPMVIAEFKRREPMAEVSIKDEAQKIWDTMDENERHGVKFGLFPANKMPQGLSKEHTHDLTVALMKMA